MKKIEREVILDKITQKKTRSSQVYDYCAKIMLKKKKEVQIFAPKYDRERAGANSNFFKPQAQSRKRIH